MGHIKRVNMVSNISVMGVPLTVHWRAYSDSGQLYGPVERCYPPEQELEVLVTILDGSSIDYEAVFSDAFIDAMEGALWGLFDDEGDEE